MTTNLDEYKIKITEKTSKMSTPALYEYAQEVCDRMNKNFGGSVSTYVRAKIAFEIAFDELKSRGENIGITWML